MADGLRFDPSGMLRGLDAYQQKTAYAINAAAKVGAAQMERDAQTHYPWTPRSGRAHQGIRGTVQERGFGARITLSGNVYYMVYLELARGKKWAILWPTIRKMGPEVLRALNRLR